MSQKNAVILYKNLRHISLNVLHVTVSVTFKGELNKQQYLENWQ